MQKAGYIPIATFVLPENCWIEHFYAPQVSAQEKFLKKYAGSKTAEELVENQRHEAELYYKYNDSSFAPLKWRRGTNSLG